MNQRTVVYLSFSLFALGLLWGGYTFLVYLGIPVHHLVYSTQEEVQTMTLACGSAASIGVYLCRGSAVVIPFLAAIFQMSSPFALYILLSVLLYGGLLLWNGYSTGYFQIRRTVRPVYLIAAFALSVWLIATTLSFGTLYNVNTPENEKLADENGVKILPPLTRFYEPLQQVYNGVGPQGLAELQANYQSLLQRGCLGEPIGTTQNGAKVFNLSIFCMQQSFFARVGTQFVLVLFFLLNLLVLGRFLLTRALQLTSLHPLLTLCFSFGIGALAWVAILWTLAVFGLLHTTPVRLLFVGIPIVLFPQTVWWAKEAWNRTFTLEATWKSLVPVLGWLLITYLALNFLNVVRPFPIGWDDLGSYLNRPRLLASYGTFIPSMSQFQWEYLSSLGWILFGYDSWVASTFAMIINWSAGLLAVLSVYAFGRLYFGRGGGLLSAILYYFLPMVGHFSFADMKIDNAVFFASTIALLGVFAAIFPPPGSEAPTETTRRRMLLAAGLMAGFAFAIKPTAVLSILMISSIIGGAILGPLGFTGMAIAGFAVLQKFGGIDVNAIAGKAMLGVTLSQSIAFIVTLLIALAPLGYALYRKKNLVRPLLLSLGFFVVGTAVAAAPWMLHNAWLKQHWSPTAMLTAPDRATPQIFYEQQAEVERMQIPAGVPVRYLPPELKLDPRNPACTISARTEELDRYWGFSTGFLHYLTLPWRQVMNIDAFGYYVTLMPALLLFPLLLLVPFFWTQERRWLRLLFAGTCVFLIQWMFAANGIPWYGVGMFLGFVLTLEAFIAYAPDKPNRSLFGFLITMGIIVCLLNRLWQFDSQKNIFEYPLGKVTASALREMTIPDYDNVRDSVVSRHETLTDTPYTFRMGTFISYFIPKNREILPLADNQVGFFNCLNQERDHLLTLKRLIALGFNSIIFDTNTQTIERDPNGTLHQKVNAFMDFANDQALGLSIPVYDPGNGIAYILLPVEAMAASGSNL